MEIVLVDNMYGAAPPFYYYCFFNSL